MIYKRNKGQVLYYNYVLQSVDDISHGYMRTLWHTLFTQNEFKGSQKVEI